MPFHPPTVEPLYCHKERLDVSRLSSYCSFNSVRTTIKQNYKYLDPVRTAQKTHHVSVVKTKWLMFIFMARQPSVC